MVRWESELKQSCTDTQINEDVCPSLIVTINFNWGLTFNGTCSYVVNHFNFWLWNCKLNKRFYPAVLLASAHLLVLHADKVKMT